MSQGDVLIVRKLVKEMAGVSALVASAAVVGAAHVGPLPDPEARPSLPLAAGIEADRDDRRFAGASQANQEQAGPDRGCTSHSIPGAAALIAAFNIVE